MSNHRLAAGAVALSLHVLGLAGPARAQTTPMAPAAAPTEIAPGSVEARYQQAVDLGFNEFAAGNYPEARARFLEAQGLVPNARISRALGMVEYELRNYAESIAYLKDALAGQVRALAPDQRGEVEKLIAQARAYLARYTIVPQPAHASLFLDGRPLVLGSDRSVVLQVGDHVLEARAEGYWPAKQVLRVIGRADEVVDLRLQARPSDDAVEATSLWESPWLWTGVGAVAVGATVALIVVLQPHDQRVYGEPTTTAQTPAGVSIVALGGR